MIEEMAVRVCLVHFTVAQAEQLAFSVLSVMPHVYHAHAVKDCLGQVILLRNRTYMHALSCHRLEQHGMKANRATFHFLCQGLHTFL